MNAVYNVDIVDICSFHSTLAASFCVGLKILERRQFIFRPTGSSDISTFSPLTLYLHLFNFGIHIGGFVSFFLLLLFLVRVLTQLRIWQKEHSPPPSNSMHLLHWLCRIFSNSKSIILRFEEIASHITSGVDFTNVYARLLRAKGMRLFLANDAKNFGKF